MRIKALHQNFVLPIKASDKDGAFDIYMLLAHKFNPTSNGIFSMDMKVAPAPLVESKALRLTLFLFLMSAMFMATLDNQIVSTALPTIVGEFGQMERFGWVGSAYLLATCAVMPLYGKLGDLFGRKYVMLSAILIFTLGSKLSDFKVLPKARSWMN